MAPKRTDSLDYLTGRLSGLPRPHWISEPGGGGKFTPAGRVLPFPGNTTVFHIDPASDAHAALTDMQNALKAGPDAGHFTFLPPDSFHMTLFQGVSGNPLSRDHWPGDVTPDASRDALSRVFQDRLAGLDVPQGLRVRATDLFAGHSVTVQGATDADEQALRQARRQMRDQMRLFPPHFDDYVFHISLSYVTHWLDDAAARRVIALSDDLHAHFGARLSDIRLRTAEFCTFDDMYHFAPLMPLRQTEKAAR
ncbi:DUF1868 domain-containing protein [Paracoccus sp. (in: a-proteobacteria)]|uniref:DUF1868 domain-containing protein n=1 Tax=Paracoccus sp. TaxID=267 RepID=UPI0026DF110D|nr:DUF1868 domain-containing protein [Paracoccus sp. (in: a-proteobacteria)]MDO5647628.1 DUF1868 domain-containing protein [Paracoccus sp. (in: a-proteobacteria)]